MNFSEVASGFLVQPLKIHDNVKLPGTTFTTTSAASTACTADEGH